MNKANRKATGIVLPVLLLLPGLLLLFAATAPSVSAFSGSGSGTSSNPYVITSVTQLQEIQNNLSAYYIIGSDIDASSTQDLNPAFEPIGTEANPFNGSFDGRGHKITGLYINKGTSGISAGLFRWVGSGGIIKNVGLESVYIKSGSGGVGGLVGLNDGGTVTQCYSTGTVISGSSSYAGGLVGFNKGTVSNSYSTASVTGPNVAGGFVGWNGTSGTVTNCYSIGLVGYANSSGGFCGMNSGTVSNSFWDIDPSGQEGSDGGTGHTTAEMKTQSTFTSAGWDFTSIWGMQAGINSGYPFLQVFYAPSPPSTLWCDGTANPTRITNTTPAFSAVGTDLQGDQMSYYALQVTTDSTFVSITQWDKAKTTITAFNSGARCSNITYAGSGLSRGATYYWRVKFWDTNGYEGQWSAEAATFKLNQLPTTPTGWTDLGMNLTDHTPTIIWTKGTDADTDTVTTYVYVGTTSTPTTQETTTTGTTADLGSTVTLSDGVTYYYRLRSGDGYEYSDYTTADSFRMNTPPATPTLLSPADGTWTSSLVFSATVTDPESDSVTAKFVIGGNTYTGSTVASGSDSTYTHTADLNGVAWYAYAQDPQGEISGSTTPWTAYIDTSAPGEVTSPSTTPPTSSSSYSSTTNPTVTWTTDATDSGSGIQKYQTSINGGAWADFTKGGAVPTAMTSQAAANTIKIRAVNNAGLTSTGVTISYYCDTSNPTAGTANDGTAGDIDWQNSATTIYANWSGFSDAQSGITRYEWAIGTTVGGFDTQAFASVVLATSASSSTLTLTNGQIYYVTVRATNGAGLQVTATSDGVTLDTTTPSAPSALDSNNANTDVWTTSTDHTFTWATVASTSGLANWYYTTDGNDPTTGSSNTGSGATRTFTYNGVSNGTYAIKVRAYNNAGTLGSVSTFTLKVDSTTPTGFTLVSPTGWVADQTPDVVLSLSEVTSGVAVSTVEYAYSTTGSSTPIGWGAVSGVYTDAACTISAVDGDTGTIYAKILGVAFNQDSETLNTIRIRATDIATNAGTQSSASTIKVDTTAPTDGSITYTDGYYATASVSITLVNGTDAGSGLGTRKLQHASATLTGGTVGSWGSFSDLATNPASPYTDSTVQSGYTYKYQYLVYDQANNLATYTSASVAKIDASTPNIVAVDAGASLSDRISLTSGTWFNYAATGSDGIVSFSWTDPNSPSDDVFYYELNATATEMITGGESVVTTAYKDGVTISAGTSYFHVKPKNGAGTWGTERIFTVKYDTTAPTVTALYISISGASGTGGTYKAGDTVTAIWNNTSTGNANTDISTVTMNFTAFGGGAAVTATNSAGTWTVSYVLSTGIEGTNKNVSVTATDDAGNATTTLGTSNATVDTAAPTSQDTVFASSVSKKGGATVTIVSSGDATNSVWFAPSGTTTFAEGATMTKAASGTETSILAPATEGAYRLFVIDAAGNRSAQSTAILTVDTTAPISPTISIAEEDPTSSVSINLTLSADGASYMWIDGDVTDTATTKEWITYATSAAVALTSGDGLKTVTVKYKDAAGNETSPVQDTITYAALVTPTVTTSAASSVGETTATLNGEVTSDGGAAITERGFYCDTSTSPTTKYTVSGTTGTYTKGMTGLSSGTKYYFKAFATNSEGTSYGSVLDFTTSTPTSTPPSDGGTPSPTTYAVSVTITPSGAGTVSGAGSYAQGASVTLAATPASGYQFSSWGGYISGAENTKVFTMPAQGVSVTATFATIPPENENIPVENAPAMPPSVVVVGKLTPGENAVVVFENRELPVLGIVIVPAASAEGVSLSTQVMGSMPAGVDVPTNAFTYTTYTIMDISISVTPDTIQCAVIAFAVERLWLEQNNISDDNIVLLRWRGGIWQELPTLKVGDNATHLLYASLSPGFSLFVIAGRVPAQAVPTYRLVLPAENVVGQTTITVRVSNPTSTAITKLCELRIGSYAIPITIEVGAGQDKDIPLILDITGFEGGVYGVLLFDLDENTTLASGQMTVKAAPAPTPAPAPSDYTWLAVVFVVIGAASAAVAGPYLYWRVRLPKTGGNRKHRRS